MAKVSAGLLMYRVDTGGPEVLLVHPGGPYYKNKDEGAWSIPKGEAREDESDLLEVAKREFKEETGFAFAEPFTSLGSVKNSSGKTIHAWAFEGACNPEEVQSNTTHIEWPPRSGKQLEIPEMDQAAFVSLEEARRRINKYQVPFIDALEQALGRTQ